MTGRNENNANCLPGRRKPKPQRRFKKRLSTILHTHVALIICCTLAVLDAGCVIGQIISDILIMKDELQEKQLQEIETKRVLLNLFPARLNRSEWEGKPLKDVLVILRECFNDIKAKDIQEKRNAIARLLSNTTPHYHGKNHDDNDHRHKRAAGGNHQHNFADKSKYFQHHILHELTHAFHLGSMVILTILLIETLLKIFAMGKKFLNHKVEVFDAFVILVSWILDVAFWEGLWAHPEDEAANIMMFILPWRVIRIVNSFIMVIQEKDHLQLKIVKQQYRGSVKRASDMKMKVELYRIELRALQSLCRRKGASDREIQHCAPEGKRRRSSLLPVLTRLASVGLLGSVSSSTDLTKEMPSNDTSDEEEDSAVVDLSSRPNSGYSNFSSSDCLSLGRTISTASSVSAITYNHNISTENLVKDNPAFIEECPPDYKEVTADDEDCSTKL